MFRNLYCNGHVPAESNGLNYSKNCFVTILLDTTVELICWSRGMTTLLTRAVELIPWNEEKLDQNSNFRWVKLKQNCSHKDVSLYIPYEPFKDLLNCKVLCHSEWIKLNHTVYCSNLITVRGHFYAQNINNIIQQFIINYMIILNNCIQCTQGVIWLKHVCIVLLNTSQN